TTWFAYSRRSTWLSTKSARGWTASSALSPPLPNLKPDHSTPEPGAGHNVMAKPSVIRHFLDLDEIDARTLRRILNAAHTMKAAGKRVPVKLRPKGIADDVLVLIFEKPSTRTRVSFDIAMRQLGGQTIMLNQTDLQLGRGESIGDTARVLSRYADAIMIRANAHQTLLDLAGHATIPVINGLTDKTHPCQI